MREDGRRRRKIRRRERSVGTERREVRLRFVGNRAGVGKALIAEGGGWRRAWEERADGNDGGVGCAALVGEDMAPRDWVEVVFGRVSFWGEMGWPGRCAGQGVREWDAGKFCKWGGGIVSGRRLFARRTDGWLVSCKAFSAGDGKVSRHCVSNNGTAGKFARRCVGNKYGDWSSGTGGRAVVSSYVCELVLDDVSAWELDLVRDFVRPGDDRVLEDELDGDDGGVRRRCVLDSIIHRTLDLVIKGLSIERAPLQEDVVEVVAAAAEALM